MLNEVSSPSWRIECTNCNGIMPFVSSRICFDGTVRNAYIFIQSFDGIRIRKFCAQASDLHLHRMEIPWSAEAWGMRALCHGAAVRPIEARSPPSISWFRRVIWNVWNSSKFTLADSIVDTEPELQFALYANFTARITSPTVAYRTHLDSLKLLSKPF